MVALVNELQKTKCFILTKNKYIMHNIHIVYRYINYNKFNKKTACDKTRNVSRKSSVFTGLAFVCKQRLSRNLCKI